MSIAPDRAVHAMHHGDFRESLLLTVDLPLLGGERGTQRPSRDLRAIRSRKGNGDRIPNDQNEGVAEQVDGEVMSGPHRIGGDVSHQSCRNQRDDE